MPVIEMLRVIHVGRDRHVLGIAEYPGEAMRVVLPLRTIIAEALRLGSSGLLLSHNHPSGDPTPSPADISATQQLARAARALDIRLVDHIISGDGSSVSFRALGLI